MTEDRFEEFLREGLADYNRPPEPPTEAMWSRIEATRAEQRAGHGSSRRAAAFPVWAQWAAGLAATLVVGIAIGRLSLDRHAASPPEGRAAAVTPKPEATGPVATVAAPSSDTQDAGSSAEAGDRLAGATPDRQTRGAAGRRAAAAVGAPSPAAAEAGGLPAMAEGGRVGGNANRGGASAGYRLAALHTFGQAEALLTAVRTAPDDSVDYQQLSDWARDVLASTRLLLDSPAGRDPVTARLLSDLELVLVQVAGLADDRDAGRELIQGALQQRDVLPRLRAVVPAGSMIGT